MSPVPDEIGGNTAPYSVQHPANSSARILVCGMPRSLTTWTFNAVAKLLRDPPKTLWIEPGSAEEIQFMREDGVVLAKCHHFDEALAAASSVVLYSYRDIRMAAISYRRKFGSPYSSAQLDSWIENGRHWMPIADLNARYETEISDLPAAVARLRAALARSGVPLSDLTDAQVVDAVERRFDTSAKEEKIRYDSSSMILPQHRTFSPEPDRMSTAERSIYDRITFEQADWLRAFGYLPDDAPGENVESRVASLLLAKLASGPVVFDADARRGAFVRLALDAGASKVVGFEPLPRHMAHLREVFMAEPRASFYPIALSDRGGRALLHIAVGADGRELDRHHTLADLGDSTIVARSGQSVAVESSKLSDVVRRKKLPDAIDFLRIDDGGHCPALLTGLGDIRPRIIMAAFWDGVAEISRVSPCRPADLAGWARSNGYDKLVVVRRNGRQCFLEIDSAFSSRGDQGSVFMLRSDVSLAPVERDLQQIASELHESNLQYIHQSIRDIELKEHETRRLDSMLLLARQELDGHESQQRQITSSIEEKEAVIQELKAAHDDASRRLQGYADVSAVVAEKEKVIGQLDTALADAQLRLRHVEAELPAAKAAVVDLQQQASAKEAVIQELKTAHDQAQSRLVQQSVELNSSRHLLAALEARSEVTEAIVRELKQAYAGAQSHLEHMRGIADQRSAELAGLRQLLDAGTAERSAKDTEIRDLRSALEAARGQTDQLGRVVEQQTAQLAADREVLAAAENRRTMLDELRVAHADSLARIAEGGVALNARATELSEARAALAASAAKLENLTAALEERNQSLKVLEQTAVAASVAGAVQTNRALVSMLEDKEAVIQELAKAVDAYRGAFRVLNVPRRSAARMKSVLGGARTRLRKMSEPRLGRLHQYPPRPLNLPARYTRPVRLTATPKVSIITPSFRQAAFIGRTIDSVLAQDYPQLEYFVQDGGSDDGTVAILEKYADRLTGWESKRDGGQSQAINLGFARTTGEIMAWINSDDVLLPCAVNFVVDYFNRHPDVDVIYGDRLLIDENDKEIGRWVMPPHHDEVLSWVDYVPQETMYWRRRIWDKAGGRIDESFKFAMDWDLLVRFRDAGARFAHVRRFLGAFRVHEQQKTSAVINEVGHREMDRIRTRALGRLPDSIEIRDAVRPYLVKHLMRHTMHRVKAAWGGE